MSDEPAATKGEVTRLLGELADGRRDAWDDLFPLIYDELRRLAGYQLQRERREHTLQATALVHEAFLKLADQSRAQFREKSHFFAVASQAMRRILVDYARQRSSSKRWGDQDRVALTLAESVSADPATEILAVDEALKLLQEVDPRQAELVVLRYFGGLEVAEVAEALGISERTAAREWRAAQAWLRSQLAS